MLMRKLPYLLRHAREIKKDITWRLTKNSYETIYFYTFHKCASSLFSNYVLKNIHGLKNVDYARLLYDGEQTGEVTFEDKGYIYGPIRLSTDPNPDYPGYKWLVKPTSEDDFIRGKIAIFLIRDPRDILVSAYYSFAFSHGFSPVENIRKIQEEGRKEIQKMTIDEYVLDYAPTVLGHFEAVERLSKTSGRSVILKYEDMIQHWDKFDRGLCKYLTIKPNVLDEIYNRSRPREKENQESHRRSGMPGGFRTKLASATLVSLDELFGPVLERFGFDS
jgi:hypothetical protein